MSSSASPNSVLIASADCCSMYSVYISSIASARARACTARSYTGSSRYAGQDGFARSRSRTSSARGVSSRGDWIPDFSAAKFPASNGAQE